MPPLKKKSVRALIYSGTGAFVVSFWQERQWFRIILVHKTTIRK